MKRRKIPGWWLAGLMYGVFMALTALWVSRDTVPLPFDQAGYMAISAVIGWQLRHARILAAWQTFFNHGGIAWGMRPALFPLVGGFALLVGGPSVHAIELLANALWILLLVVATFLTGRRLGGDRVGLLAVFLVLTMPLVAGAARTYRVDLPLTATVTLAMGQLLRPKYFRTVYDSIWFALAVALGMLVKETFLFYVAVPILIHLTLMFRETDRWERFRRFGLGAALAAFLVTPVYLPILVPLLQNVFSNVGNGLGRFYARPYARNQAGYYLVYVKSLFNVGISFPYLLIPALAWLVSRFSGKRGAFRDPVAWFLAAWLVVPVAVLTLWVVDTDVRFIMPVLPAAAIITAAGIGRLDRGRIRRVAVGSLVVLGCVQFLAQSFGVPGLPARIAYKGWYLWNQSPSHDLELARPIRQDWPILPLLETASAGGLPVSVGILANSDYLSGNILTYYAALHRLPVRTVSLGMAGGGFDQTDYVITKTGDPGIFFDPAAYAASARYFAALVRQGRYRESGVFPLPDGSVARLYQRD